MGQKVFGENKVQEAKKKCGPLKSRYNKLELHLIGALQTNKVKDAVSIFDVIETIDRPKLAVAIAKEMTKQATHLPCYIQVNTGEEKQKAGIYPSETGDFVDYCRNDLALNIVGLMCIPPANDAPALHFSLLATIAERMNLESLSMGMSNDYETAIKLGATHIRLGTALFGKRALLIIYYLIMFNKSPRFTKDSRLIRSKLFKATQPAVGSKLSRARCMNMALPLPMIGGLSL